MYRDQGIAYGNQSLLSIVWVLGKELGLYGTSSRRAQIDVQTGGRQVERGKHSSRVDDRKIDNR